MVFDIWFLVQVDAMKTGVKEMKKAYKQVKIDQIEVMYTVFKNCWKYFVGV